MEQRSGELSERMPRDFSEALHSRAGDLIFREMSQCLQGKPNDVARAERPPGTSIGMTHCLALWSQGDYSKVSTKSRMTYYQNHPNDYRNRDRGPT